MRTETQTLKPSQIFTATMLCVPFLRFNDPNRLQMASNHLRQNLMIVNSEIPKIRTGFENAVIKYAESFLLKTNKFEKVEDFLYETDKGLRFVSAFMQYDDKLKYAYNPYFITFVRDIVNGELYPELKFGVNARVAYMPYYGFNYQDAIVVSESFAKRTSHLQKQVIVVRIPANFVLRPIKSNDGYVSLLPVVGKTYKTLISFDYIENGLIYHKQINVDDLHVVDIRAKALPNHKFPGFITELIAKSVKPYKLAKLDTEPTPKHPLVLQIVGYKIKPTEIGDKITNRHGNKGVIGLVVPDEEMPKTSDGKTIDVIFSPLSVPSRMNLGQLMENLLAKIVVAVEERVLSLLDSGKKDQALNMLKEFLLDVEKRTTFRYVLETAFKKNADVIVDNIQNHGLSIIQPHFAELHPREIKQLAKKYGVKETENVKIDKDYTVLANVGYQTILKTEHLAVTKVTGAGITNNEFTNPQRIGEMETWNIVAHDYAEIHRLFRRSYDFEKLQYYKDKFNLDAEVVVPEFKTVYQVYKSVLLNE